MQLWESLPAFLVLTLFLGGGAAYLTGRAVARGWSPYWLAAAYMVPLAAVLRFLHFALASGRLLAVDYFLVDLVILIGLSALGYRLARVRMMVRQYPWLYQRRGPLGWRAGDPPAGGAPPLPPG